MQQQRQAEGDQHDGQIRGGEQPDGAVGGEIDAAAQDDSSVKAGEAAEDASSGSAKMAEAMPMATDC